MAHGKQGSLNLGVLHTLSLALRRSFGPLFTVGLFLSLCGCADLKGIQTFGKMAPDPSTIQGLTKVYSQELDTREDIKLLGDDAPIPDLVAQDATRAQEARAIQGMDHALQAYMQSLVALANGSIVQSGTNTKNVTTGLTSLQKSHPALGITNSQISDVGDFVQSIADLAESGYRNAKLVAIIHDSDAPLQQLLSLQATIVTDAITPSIQEIQRSLKERAIDHGLTYIDEDLQNWTVTPGCNSPLDKTPAAKMFDRRNPIYRGQGETDAHVARYLLKRSVEADQATLSGELATADAYTKALQKIGEAHRKLVAMGNNVLTKEMVQQIQPLADEVHKDFQDLEALATAPRKH
jgi:hypothetical protein